MAEQALRPAADLALRAGCAAARAYFRHMPGRFGKQLLWDRLVRPYLLWRSFPIQARTGFGAALEGRFPDAVHSMVYFFGVWEPAVTAVFRDALKPGDIVVDIGANVGLHTMLAAGLVGPAGRVHAIEASPWIHARLLRNLAANGIDNVIVHHVAATAVEGPVQVFLHDESNLGGTTIIAGEAARSGAPPEAVVPGRPVPQIVPIDDLLAARLIKIDVEGAEWLVLQGLAPVLPRLHPDCAILLEVKPAALEALGGSLAEVIAMMAEAGFAAFEIENGYGGRDYIEPPPPPRPLRPARPGDGRPAVPADNAAVTGAISVVVPTYNRAALLPRTLDAILAQTCPARDVILVDDGSTDDTVQAVAGRYGDRVTILQVANGGDLAARNAGLARARGDLVAFCDSDDLWQPGFLAAMSALWRAEPRMRVAFGNFRLLRDGNVSAQTKFDEAPDGFWDGLRELAPGMAVFDAPLVERVIGFQPFFPSCMVADRGFLVGLGGWDVSVGRTVGTDFATILLLAEHAPFGILRDPLVSIRKHAGNYSADVQAMNLGDAAILEHVLARRPSLAGLATAIERSVARRRAQALDLAFARHDHAAVTRIYRQLPADARGWRAWAKASASALPRAIRRPLMQGLLAAGSWRAH